ncbi:MAG: hypothetical protein ACE5OQ_02285 [Woeseia sp.]
MPHTAHGWPGRTSSPYGGDIRGFVAAPVVSSELGVVIIIDSYPDLATYLADVEAYSGTEDGEKLEAGYDAVSNCTANALYSVTESRTD